MNFFQTGTSSRVVDTEHDAKLINLHCKYNVWNFQFHFQFNLTKLHLFYALLWMVRWNGVRLIERFSFNEPISNFLLEPEFNGHVDRVPWSMSMHYEWPVTKWSITIGSITFQLSWFTINEYKRFQRCLEHMWYFQSIQLWLVSVH